MSVSDDILKDGVTLFLVLMAIVYGFQLLAGRFLQQVDELHGCGLHFKDDLFHQRDQ